MTILGIDPGFGITGYGIIAVDPRDFRHPSLVEAGVFRSDKNRPLSERLSEIYEHLVDLIREFKPESIAVEDIFSVHGFPRSAILIGHVRGIVLLAAAQCKTPVYSYYPLKVKKSLVGNGYATKSQIQKMVQTTLGLNETPRPDDLSDALAIALCHASHSQTRQSLPSMSLAGIC